MSTLQRSYAYCKQLSYKLPLDHLWLQNNWLWWKIWWIPVFNWLLHNRLCNTIKNSIVTEPILATCKAPVILKSCISSWLPNLLLLIHGDNDGWHLAEDWSGFKDFNTQGTTGQHGEGCLPGKHWIAISTDLDGTGSFIDAFCNPPKYTLC